MTKRLLFGQSLKICLHHLSGWGGRVFFNLKPRVPRQRKKDLANMENFAQLLEEYSAVQEMNQGEVITAEVVAITDKHVIVNAG